MNKQNVVDPYNTMGYYTEIKRNELLIHTIEINLKCILLRKRSQMHKAYIIYGFVYITLEKAKLQGRKQISGCQGQQGWREWFSMHMFHGGIRWVIEKLHMELL